MVADKNKKALGSGPNWKKKRIRKATITKTCTYSIVVSHLIMQILTLASILA